MEKHTRLIAPYPTNQWGLSLSENGSAVLCETVLMYQEPCGTVLFPCLLFTCFLRVNVEKGRSAVEKSLFVYSSAARMGRIVNSPKLPPCLGVSALVPSLCLYRGRLYGSQKDRGSVLWWKPHYVTDIEETWGKVVRVCVWQTIYQFSFILQRLNHFKILQPIYRQNFTDPKKIKIKKPQHVPWGPGPAGVNPQCWVQCVSMLLLYSSQTERRHCGGGDSRLQLCCDFACTFPALAWGGEWLCSLWGREDGSKGCWVVWWVGGWTEESRQM